MDSGADLLLVGPEQEDEQRLREAPRERRSLHLRGDEPPDGEEVGPCLGLFRQFLDGVLRSSALWLVPELLATTAHRLRPRDQGAQPYPSRGVSRDDVAEVVHPKVHPAE